MSLAGAKKVIAPFTNAELELFMPIADELYREIITATEAAKKTGSKAQYLRFREYLQAEQEYKQATIAEEEAKQKLEGSKTKEAALRQIDTSLKQLAGHLNEMTIAKDDLAKLEADRQLLLQRKSENDRALETSRNQQANNTVTNKSGYSLAKK